MVQCWGYGTAFCRPGQSICPARRSSKVMKSLLGIHKAKVAIGLLIGIGLLFLVSRFINVAVTFHVVLQHLATPRGLILALLSGIAFLLAFSVRGIRWKLFLNPIGNVS